MEQNNEQLISLVDIELLINDIDCLLEAEWEES